MFETSLMQLLNPKQNYLELFTAAEQYAFHKFTGGASILLSVKLAYISLVLSCTFLKTKVLFSRLRIALD